jgi:Phage capsid family
MSARPLVPSDLVELRRTQQSNHIRSLARAAIASAHYSLDKSVRNFEGRTWPGDKDVELILRGAVPPASMASASAVSPIVPSFLASLIPLSAGAALLQEGVVLRWNGAAAITLPTITSIVADWISELAPIPVRGATTGPGVRLDPFKLAVITTLSSEMVRSSNAEEIVSDVLKKSVGPALDAALFSNVAGTPGLRPPGLLNGVTALTPSTATPKSEAMADDLSSLAAAVAAYSGNGRIGFAMAVKQAIRVSLQAEQFSFPLLMSSQIPAGTVIAIALPAICSVVESVPQIDSSQVALLHEETAPLPISSPGTPPTLASPVRSLYQTDSAAVRLRLPVSWVVRTPAAVAWMSAVTW